jgi:undecaprenyl-diphosphatase
MDGMPSPLIAGRWRGPAVAVAAVGLAVVGVLAAVVHHGRSTAFDNWAFRRSAEHIGSGTARFLLDLSAPKGSILLLVLLVVFAAWRRRWNVAALAVLAPMVVVGLTELVLKPLVGRTLHPAAVNDLLPLSIRSVYPSGHEATVAATAFVLVIVVSRLPLRASARAAAVAVLAAWVLASAVGLVRNYWHYPTDTIGAIGLAAAGVVVVALGIDRYGAAFAQWLRRAWRVPERV